MKNILKHFRRQNKKNFTKSASKDFEGVLVACGSFTNKKINRDAFAIIKNDLLDINGVAIADGIGNTLRVEEASKVVVEYMKAEIERLEKLEDLSLKKIIDKCQYDFNKKFNKETESNQFGTTLIVALEYNYQARRKIKIAYLGNGAIWHIKGNFNHFDKNQLFPWNCVNYLNPHSIQQEGQEALFNSISLESTRKYFCSSNIDFTCDSEFGDIIMVCSDGIYSYDQLLASRDSTGRLWLQFGESLELFYEYLNNYFKESDHTAESLNEMIRNYLKRLSDENLLDDDATLGIIILPKALAYQKHLQNEPNHKSQ